MNDDEILERALAGELSPPEEEALAGRLKAEPELARRMMSLSRDEALLAEGVAEARARRSLASPALPPAARPGRLRWIVAAAAAAGLLVLVYPRGETAGATITELRGQADLDDRPAAEGDRVAPGAVLQTGPEARVTVRLPDGGTFVLSGGVRLVLHRGGRAQLDTGTLVAQIQPSAQAWVFTTPHAEAKVLGTRFALSADPGSTFLEVREGRVELRRGAEAVEVAEGQLAVAEPGRPLTTERTTPPPPAAPDFGSGRGLRAQYFDNEDLTNLKLARIDASVDFVWGLGSPHASLENDYFSVRWRGEVEPLFSETYTFHVVSDDGARLWVDGRLIVDDWNVRGTRERTGEIALKAGRRYDLRLEYFDCVSPARASLFWSSLSQKREVIPTSQLYPAPSENHLIDETFSEGKLTPGLWDARLEGATFDPGYLNFWAAPPDKAPSLHSIQKYDRKAGLCLATVYCGTVHRAGAKGENPVFQFSSAVRPQDRDRAGPGWAPGQHQGRFMNTAVPLIEAAGWRNYPVRNDNVDTMFLVVLREKGAFYLVCDEPSSVPPRAKLVHVSHTGDEKAYHVGVSGGQGNTRVASVTLTDLGGAWAEPYGLAAIVDRFDRTDLGRPEKGGAPWESSGRWTVSGGTVSTASADAFLLTEAGAADGQWEATVQASSDLKPVALVARAKDAKNHLRFELSVHGSKLIRRADGVDSEIAATGWREVKLQAGRRYRLAMRLEGPHVNLFIDDVAATYGRDLPPVDAPGTNVGVSAAAGAVFSDFVGWPVSVEIPEALAAKIPPIHLGADGDVLLRDDFEAPDGTPLEGRKPKWGVKTWKVGRGEWVIERGAAVLKAEPGWARIDCGTNNYEITATIELPRTPPPPKKDWFPAIHARCPGWGAIEPHGGINARFLWQSGSNEIEVWDRPGESPDNRARWAAKTGPHAGRILTELINATNITPMIRPGETHVLRIVVRGSRVSYLCDGILVGTANTRVSHGAWVGLNVDDQGDASVRFLDFTVRAFRTR